MQTSKRGALMNEGVMVVMGIIMIGTILGAGVIGVASMNTTYQSTLNSNSSLWTVAQLGAVGAMGNSTNGLVNFSIQLPTVGTIAAVGLIITVLIAALAGAYLFFAKR